MVDRCLLTVEFAAWATEDGCGRVPMVPTPEPTGAFDPFTPPPWRGGDPPGDEAEVRLDCWAALFSNRLKLVGFDDGEELLFARERCLDCCITTGDGPAVLGCCCCCCPGSSDDDIPLFLLLPSPTPL